MEPAHSDGNHWEWVRATLMVWPSSCNGARPFGRESPPRNCPAASRRGCCNGARPFGRESQDEPTVFGSVAALLQWSPPIRTGITCSAPAATASPYAAAMEPAHSDGNHPWETEVSERSAKSVLQWSPPIRTGITHPRRALSTRRAGCNGARPFGRESPRHSSRGFRRVDAAMEPAHSDGNHHPARPGRGMR